MNPGEQGYCLKPDPGKVDSEKVLVCVWWTSIIVRSILTKTANHNGRVTSTATDIDELL